LHLAGRRPLVCHTRRKFSKVGFRDRVPSTLVEGKTDYETRN
jgi:hypothetical protein